jgi:hypothetical protein
MTGYGIRPMKTLGRLAMIAIGMLTATFSVRRYAFATRGAAEMG